MVETRTRSFGVGQKNIEEAFMELGLSKNAGMKRIPPWTKQTGDSKVLHEVSDIRPAVIRLGLGKGDD